MQANGHKLALAIIGLIALVCALAWLTAWWLEPVLWVGEPSWQGNAGVGEPARQGNAPLKPPEWETTAANHANVKIGMTASEVESVMGKPSFITTKKDGVYPAFLTHDDVRLYHYPGKADNTAMVIMRFDQPEGRVIGKYRPWW